MREELAERAARRILCGQGTEAIRAPLRLIYTAELLSSPECVCAVDLNAELEAVCAALQASVRRRPGWLYYAVPDAICPVAASARLLQAAVCSAAAGVLGRSLDARLVVTVLPQRSGAALLLRGSEGLLDGDTTALLRRLGGAVMWRGGMAVRLAESRLPPRPATSQNSLLCDKFSPLYLYTGAFCADPEV